MKTELFDRYVHEVGRRLPRKQRADVQAELHSLLMDALQERLGEDAAAQEAAPEAEQIAVLSKFGPPARMVDAYMPGKRYVVGPRLFGIYQIVVASVAGAMTLAYLILFGLSMWGQADLGSAFLPTFAKVFGSYAGALLSGLGSVTLTFYILERVLPESATEEDDDKEWDPRSLPAVQDRTRVEVAGLVIESVLLVAALVLFNFFPQWVGIHFVGTIGEGPLRWRTWSALAPVFFTAYLPMLNVLWVVNLGLNAVLLGRGRWQRATYIADVVLLLGEIFILGRMISGPPLLVMDGIEPAGLRDALSFLPTLFKVALALRMIGAVAEGIQKMVFALRAESATSYSPPSAEGSAAE